ncbi:MAG: hypothetical protein ACREX8_02065 [Gammaproteobacteria bacterium]
MATITLHSMHCVKKQDSISDDDIKVILDGENVLGTIGIEKGQTVLLGDLTRPFTGSITVQLLEVDANSNDDDLGTEFVSDGEAGTGRHSLEFDRLNNAFYTLSYSVA